MVTVDNFNIILSEMEDGLTHLSSVVAMQEAQALSLKQTQEQAKNNSGIHWDSLLKLDAGMTTQNSFQ